MAIIRRIIFCGLVLSLMAGCQSAYYGAMEKVGVHKRDIMVSRVDKAKASQQEAKEEFKSALEKFQSLFGQSDLKLQAQYDQLSDSYESSKDAAEDVSERITAVANVSEALFSEWEQELTEYTSANLRRQSSNQLNQTRRQYNKLIRSMRSAEKQMQPVLSALYDQVLFLKHNLNARAISGLKGELKSVRSNVSRLIQQMERSIKESEAFIKSLSTE